MPVKILAIETSCDETAISVTEAETKKDGTQFHILSNQVASQVKIHAPFGGVVPNLAKREHQKNLPILLRRAMEDIRRPLGRRMSKPDAVCVTCGPGLEPALWTGIEFAKALSKKWRVPLVPVNHLEGHIYSALMSNDQFLISNKNLFPLLTLIVSGGHTELVLSKKHLAYKILGETLDDAAGEAFDKVARMLGLGYPGGPVVAKVADEYQKSKIKNQNDKAKFKITLPRPIMHSKDLNFSFSGLKTAVLYLLRDLEKKYSMKEIRPAVAYEFQEAVVDVLVKKTMKAVGQYEPKTIALGGGVAANDRLREELSKKLNVLLPEKIYTGDNAAMIAVAGYYRLQAGKFAKNPEKTRAVGNLKL